MQLCFGALGIDIWGYLEKELNVSSHIKRMIIDFSYAMVFMMFWHINAANRYAAADKEIMIDFSTISNSKEFQKETRFYLIGSVVCFDLELSQLDLMQHSRKGNFLNTQWNFISKRVLQQILHLGLLFIQRAWIQNCKNE